jgi:uncharacterized protein YjbI with pentapeptide repeats
VKHPVIASALVALIDRNRDLERSLGIAPDDLSFQQLTGEQLTPLRATSEAIVSLIRKGGRVTDMSRIFCGGCDLSGTAVDLSSTNLDGAVLTEADFSHASLHHASFDGANLLGAKFIGSDLRSAKLTDLKAARVTVNALIRLQSAIPPDFRCADLSDTDFSGQVLFGVYEDNRKDSSTTWITRFNGANLQRADLAKLMIFVVTELPQPLNPKDVFSPFLPFVGPSTTWIYPLQQESGKAAPKHLIIYSGGDMALGKSLPDRFKGLIRVTEEIAGAENVASAKMPVTLRQFMKAHENAEPPTQECIPGPKS